MKLTPRQEAFADYYIQTLNAEQSAIKAGYSEKYARGNAHKLVANSCISKYIEEHMKKTNSERIASAEEVLSFLSDVMRGEDETARSSDRIKAAELLGKRHALFTDKVEQNTTASVSVKSDLDNLSVEELEKIEQILSKPK